MCAGNVGPGRTFRCQDRRTAVLHALDIMQRLYIVARLGVVGATMDFVSMPRDRVLTGRIYCRIF